MLEFFASQNFSKGFRIFMFFMQNCDPRVGIRFGIK